MPEKAINAAMVAIAGRLKPRERWGHPAIVSDKCDSQANALGYCRASLRDKDSAQQQGAGHTVKKKRPTISKLDNYSCDS